MSYLPKMDLSKNFQLMSSNMVWNDTRKTILGIRNVRRRVWFLSICTYFSSWRLWGPIFWQRFSDCHSSNHQSGLCPSSQPPGEVVGQPRCSEFYGISPYCKAQLTLVRMHFLQNKWKELLWVSTHTCRSPAINKKLKTFITP